MLKRWRWRAPLILLGTLLVLLLANAIVMGRETREAEVRSPGGQVLRLDGGDLHVTDDGPRSKRALVFFHGFACSLRWWDQVVTYFEEDYRVIRFDLLGHGGSEKPRSGYAFAEQGRLYAEALAQLGVTNAIVVGQAFGGILATPLAEARPELVDGIVAMDSPPNTEVGEQTFLIRLGLRPIIGPALRRIAWDEAIKRGYVQAFGHDDWSPFDGSVDPRLALSDYRAMTFTSYKESRADFEDYVSEAPLDERLTRLGKPVLAIFGEKDSEYDARASLEAYGRIPKAQTKLLPDTGHGPQVERPAEVARIVRPFISRIWKETAAKPSE